MVIQVEHMQLVSQLVATTVYTASAKKSLSTFEKEFPDSCRSFPNADSVVGRSDFFATTVCSIG